MRIEMTRMRLCPTVLIESFETNDRFIRIHSYYDPFTRNYSSITKGRETMAYEYSKRNGNRIVEWIVNPNSIQTIMENEGWKSTNKYKLNIHSA